MKIHEIIFVALVVMAIVCPWWALSLEYGKTTTQTQDIEYLEKTIEILEKSNKEKKETIKGLMWLVDQCGEGIVLKPKSGLKKKEK